MSFTLAAKADARLAGIPAQLQVALRQPTYGINADQIFDNLDADPEVPALPTPGWPASRLELLTILLGAGNPADPQECLGITAKFCLRHLKEGREVKGMPGRVFGRVQAFESLVSSVHDCNSGQTLEQVRANLRAMIQDASPKERFPRQRFGLAGKPLSKRQMWAFSPASAADPFAEIGPTRSEAVNRLGLGQYAADRSEPLVRWCHELPNAQRALAPTAWDSGVAPGSVYWRPGGRTRPLDGKKPGLPEVIHDPVTGGNLVTAIEPLEG